MGKAVTFLSTPDPLFNSTPPAGNLAGSGWQYEASFGPFLATAIGPHHFLTARHVGVPSNMVVYRGDAYMIVRYYDDPGSDLRILVIAETLASYAPLYSTPDEPGHDIVVIGRGMQRGNPIYVGRSLQGWDWGNADTVQRWGENTVNQANGNLLYATFDQNGKPNEAHLSSGDSGGAAFINDGQTWRLAGINYGVDGPFAYVAGGPTFYATLFDTRGLFDSTTGRVASGSAPVPSGFYMTRISTQLHWIRSVVAPALSGISAQGAVGIGNDVVNATFTIEGSPGQTKRVLIRGLGPSLAANGVALAGRLLNPQIELRDSNNVLVATNDDWNGAASVPKKKKKKKKKNPNQASATNPIQITNMAPTDAKEAALIVTLTPGQYTALLRGVNSTTGVGAIDVHDLDGAMDGATLKDMSASGSIHATNADLTIKITADSNSGRLLIKAIGPELAGGGMSDPTLELRNASGLFIASNDNWRSAPNSAEIQNTGVAPGDDRDAAILMSPAATTYTAVLRGANGATGATLLQTTFCRNRVAAKCRTNG